MGFESEVIVGDLSQGWNRGVNLGFRLGAYSQSLDSGDSTQGLELGDSSPGIRVRDSSQGFESWI